MTSVFNAHPRTRLRRAVIIEAVDAVLRGEEAGEETQVGVVLVDDETLLGMNREHLGHDYYTDVITFTLETNPLEGEIYISIDRAREQSREYGVGLYNEVYRLAIHGALHLVGYDDATTEQRDAMRDREDYYLRSFMN